MEAIIEKLPMVLGILLCLSEALAFIPSIKSNSVFQLISKGIRKAKEILAKLQADKKIEEEKKIEEKAE